MVVGMKLIFLGTRGTFSLLVSCTVFDQQAADLVYCHC